MPTNRVSKPSLSVYKVYVIKNRALSEIHFYHLFTAGSTQKALYGYNRMMYVKHWTDIVCSPQLASGSIPRSFGLFGSQNPAKEILPLSFIQVQPELGTRMLSVSLSDVFPWAARDTWIVGVSWAREKFYVLRDCCIQP